MTPNLGQGACQALEDPADLGTAQRAYQQRCRERMSQIVWQTRRLGQVERSQYLLVCVLRDALTHHCPVAIPGSTVRPADRVYRMIVQRNRVIRNKRLPGRPTTPLVLGNRMLIGLISAVRHRYRLEP
jgi:hypothetical protein